MKMQIIRKPISIILSLSMIFNLPIMVWATENYGNQSDSKSKNSIISTIGECDKKEIETLKVYTIADGNKQPLQDRVVDITEDKTNIALSKDETSILIRALDSNGETLTVGRDFSVVSDTGDMPTYTQDDGGILLQGEDIVQNELQVSDASGEEITTLLFSLENTSGDDLDYEKNFAESITYKDIALDIAEDVVITSENHKQYFRFIPDSTRKYYIYSESCKNDSEVYLYDEEGNELAYNDDGGSSMNFGMNILLDAGKTYFIGASSLEEQDSYKLNISWKLEFSDLLASATDITIQDGELQSEKIDISLTHNDYADYDQLVSFTPQKNGYYEFRITVPENEYLNNFPEILDKNGEKVPLQVNGEIYNEDESHDYYVSSYLNKGFFYFVTLKCSNSDVINCKAVIESKMSITDIQIDLKPETSGLFYGRDGYWHDYYDPEEGTSTSYYMFDGSVILDLYNIMLIYEDGTAESWDGYKNGRVSYTTNQVQNPWTIGGTNNLLTISADGVSKEVNVPVILAPKAIGMEIRLINSKNQLCYGENGYWNESYDSETDTYVKYYHFYENDILDLYEATVTFDDNTEITGTLNELVSQRIISCTTNQGMDNPWKVDGINNILTIKADEIVKSEFVEIQPYYEKYNGCPEIKEDEIYAVSYNSAEDINSGILRFIPQNDGVYNIYSTGTADSRAKLFDENAEMIALDDDGYNDYNFLIQTELTAGKVYILK